MPSLNHSKIQARLIAQFSRLPGFEVCSELNLELGGLPFTPDISLYPPEPLDLLHDQVRRSDPPLTIVEIFSPRQGYQDVMDKVDVYLRHGVKSCWVVAPPLQTVTILTADGRQETHHAGVVTDPVTGVEADLTVVFARRAGRV